MRLHMGTAFNRYKYNIIKNRNKLLIENTLTTVRKYSPVRTESFFKSLIGKTLKSKLSKKFSLFFGLSSDSFIFCSKK